MRNNSGCQSGPETGWGKLLFEGTKHNHCHEQQIGKQNPNYANDFDD